MVDAGAQAVRHLLDYGLTPLVDKPTLQALWRRGGTDRQLARELYDLAGGDTAGDFRRAGDAGSDRR